MKRLGIVGVLATVALGVAFLVRNVQSGEGTARARGGRSPDIAPETRDAAPVPNPPAVEPSALSTPTESRGSPAAIADKIRLLLTSIGERMKRFAGRSLTEQELAEVMALQREADALGAELRRALLENPRGADALIDWIFRLESETISRKITAMVAGAFDSSARERLAQVLQTSPSIPERRVAALALSTDASHTGLTSLLAASRADADVDVRRTCLQSVASRIRLPESSTDIPLIREVARSMADSDPDEQVRRTAAAIARNLDGAPPRDGLKR